MGAEGGGELVGLVRISGYPGLGDDGLLLEEDGGVLGHRFDGSFECRPRRPVGRVSMTDRNHVGPGPVHGGVKQHADGVDRPIAVKQVADVIDLDKVGDPHSTERDAHRVGPQSVVMFGVAHRYVTQQSFGEAGLSEDAADAGQPLKAVLTLLGCGVEDGSGLGDESADRFGFGHENLVPIWR